MENICDMLAGALIFTTYHFDNDNNNNRNLIYCQPYKDTWTNLQSYRKVVSSDSVGSVLSAFFYVSSQWVLLLSLLQI